MSDFFCNFTDVAQHTSFENFPKLVESFIEGEGLNLLINNAGINIRHGLVEADNESMMESYTTNVIGPLLTVQVMRDQQILQPDPYNVNHLSRKLPTVQTVKRTLY